MRSSSEKDRVRIFDYLTLFTPDWLTEFPEVRRAYKSLEERQRIRLLDQIPKDLVQQRLPLLLDRLRSASDGEADFALMLMKFSQDKRTPAYVVETIRNPIKPVELRALIWAYKSQENIMNALQMVAKLPQTQTASALGRRPLDFYWDVTSMFLSTKSMSLYEMAVRYFITLLNEKKYEQAKALGEICIAVAPGDSIFLYFYSDALEKLGNHEKAISLQNDARAVDTNDGRTRSVIAQLLRFIGRNDLAKAECLKILESNPGRMVRGRLYRQMSEICVAQKNFKEAAEWSEKCLEVAKDQKAAVLFIQKSPDWLEREIRFFKYKAESEEKERSPK